MPSSKVIVDNRFGKLQRQVDRELQRALGQAAGVTLAASRGIASRYNIADVQNHAHVTPARRYRRGWELDVVWTDWRTGFFEFGTYLKKGALKRGGDPAGPNRGVKPVRFIRKGANVGRVALINAVQRNLL